MEIILWIIVTGAMIVVGVVLWLLLIYGSEKARTSGRRHRGKRQPQIHRRDDGQ